MFIFKNRSMLKLAVIITLLLPLAEAASLSGRIVGIADGDTATLLTPEKKQVKIRLAQIDAPEKNQAFGQASKQSLSDLIYQKDVLVEVETIDKYGRTVGKILVGNNDVNLEQVRRGMAWFYAKYGKDTVYRDAEAKARNQGVGLWSEPNPVPPWEFRHGGKSSETKQSANIVASASSGSCGAKRYCKEMASCDEAMFYLKQCSLARLDRDGDGLPCESLCQ
ncbi:thermonuclease family protein [Chitinimonas sp. BJB300]|uniref:thermonuclease family protein n=1 Tax=Chitinimonas sp. BJB300 TaxID=1559339 RepID=UPI000C0D9F1A|nr:thermonuclease family protein [Chitinimonas sp. BJB300]PHV10024.1 nuclease [Chitinimonas sp. BJB300]TSJ83027.1 thermonuclease family protein [Chitinimonas sp. BJB300]